MPEVELFTWQMKTKLRSERRSWIKKAFFLSSRRKKTNVLVNVCTVPSGMLLGKSRLCFKFTNIENTQRVPDYRERVCRHWSRTRSVNHIVQVDKPWVKYGKSLFGHYFYCMCSRQTNMTWPMGIKGNVLGALSISSWSAKANHKLHAFKMHFRENKQQSNRDKIDTIPFGSMANGRKREKKRNR